MKNRSVFYANWRAAWLKGGECAFEKLERTSDDLADYMRKETPRVWGIDLPRSRLPKMIEAKKPSAHAKESPWP